MSNEYSDFEVPADELKSLVESAVWVPFDSKLRRQFTALKATVADPLFAENDGLLMVKNGSVVSYVSENGAYWGDYNLGA